jgi:hypothetical protein
MNEIEYKQPRDAFLPVTPRPVRVLLDRDQDSVTDLAFCNLDLCFLAVRCLAAGPASR